MCKQFQSAKKINRREINVLFSTMVFFYDFTAPYLTVNDRGIVVVPKTPLLG
jgi:hypothetical protein